MDKGKKKPKVIICYGDSNTYGYDPRLGGEGRYPTDLRWTGILQERFDGIVENHGICGKRIPHTKGQIQFACKQMKHWAQGDAVCVLIMLGTNDLLQEKSYQAEDVAADMEHFLREVQAEVVEEVQNLQVVLISPAKMQYGSWVTEERIYAESRRLGAKYRGVAKRLAIDFIDAGAWEIPVVFDGVHFSEEGHKNFAEQLIKSII